jgi:hypothetical protein
LSSFSGEWHDQDHHIAAAAHEALDGEVATLEQILSPGWATAPFSPAIRDCVEHLTGRILEFETQRGRISRQNRSRLCEEAQLYLDGIDQILFKLAGLPDDEIEGLDARLSQML